MPRITGWTVSRWAAGTVFSVVVASLFLLSLPFLLIRIPSVRAWILDRSLHRSVLTSEWRLRIDSVPRFDPWGVRLEGVHLLHRSPEGDREWASLSRFELRWEASDLLRNRIWAEQIGIDSLVVRFDAPTPTFRPSPRAPRAAPAARRPLPWLKLGSLRLGFRVLGADGPLADGVIALGGLEHRAGTIHGTCDRIDLFYLPESVSVVVAGGELSGQFPSTIRLRNARVSSDGFKAEVDGEVVLPAGQGRPLAVSAASTLDELRPVRIRAIRRLMLPIDEGDSLSGEVRVAFERSRFSAWLDVHGRLFDSPLESLTLLADRSGDTLVVHDLGLRHRSGSVGGEGRVFLDPLRVEGEVRLRDVDLADPTLARWIPGAPSTRFHGTIRGSASFAEEEVSVTLSGDLDVVRIFEHRPGPIEFRARIRRGVLLADELRLGTPGNAVSLQGEWATRTGEIGGVARFDGVRLEDWVEPLLQIGLAGTFRGRLDLDGSIDSVRVDGSLEGTGFRVEGVGCDTVQIDSIAGLLVPPRFDGAVRARGLDIYGALVDSASFQVCWEDRLVVHARAALDSITVATLVAITPAEPGSLVVSELSIEPGRLAPWRSPEEARVLWNAGASRIENVRLESSDGSLHGHLAVGAGGGSFDGAIRISRIDLAKVARILALPDSALGGIADLEVRLGGTPETPSIDARISVDRLIAARWPVGRLETHLILDQDGTLHVDSLEAGNVEGAGSVRARDLTIRPGRPLPALLEGIGDSLASLLDSTEISGRLQVDRLSMSRIVKVALETAPKGAKGLFGQPDDPMTARIRTVRAGGSGGTEGISTEVGGDIRFDCDLSGTAGSPRATVRGTLRDLRLYQAHADSVLFSASYAGDSVTLDSLVWHRGDRASTARGKFPLVASLVGGRTRILRDGPLSFDAGLPEIDLAILGFVSRDIVEPEGLLSGSVSLRGTPAKMWAEGSLMIRDGGIRIPKREERLRSIRGSVTLDSTGITIDSLRGKIGNDGRFAVRGMFRNLEDFDLEGEVQRATVYETGLYNFTLNGDLRAFPIDTPEGIVPLAVGTVEVLEGVIIGDLAKAPPPPAGVAPRPSPWQAEIDVYAPGNIRLQTTVASVEMGEAENLHVSFDDPKINVSGGVKVLGGRYRIFNNIFTITSGEVEFRDLGRGLVEPILDVYAETQVGTVRPGESELETETVRIHVTGPVTALNLEFSSDSGLATDEIIALLSIGRLQSESGSFEVADPSRQFLFTEVVSQIEWQMSQLIGPLQNVSVRPGDQPAGAWQLNVRQMVLPQVSLAYTRDLAGAAGQEVSVHYNLRGKLYLNAAVERRIEEGAPADRYSLDLKMRFEYK